MPLYEYRCRACGGTQTTYHRGGPPPSPPRCPLCAIPLSRRFSFSHHQGWPEHYNPTVGRVVTSKADFRSALDQASEEATVRTGIEHNFAPVDLRDTEALGVTRDGLEETFRRKHDAAVREGRTPPKPPPI